MRRAGAIVAAAAAATITMAATACGSTASGSSAPSASAHHSAGSSARSQQVSGVQCQDKAALETSLATLPVSFRKSTLNRVQADLGDLQAKLTTLMGDAHGAFSVQINALQSALTKLQAAVKGASSGSSSVAEVRTAADGVTTAIANLDTAFAQGGCIGGG